MGKISKEQEYQALRNELLQSKRFIIERPILLLILLYAIIGFIKPMGDDNILILSIPILFVLLAIFNFLFFVNRWRNIAYIAAYIRYILEDDTEEYHGWESFIQEKDSIIANNESSSIKSSSINKDGHKAEDNSNNTKKKKSLINNSLFKLGVFQLVYWFHIVIVSSSFILVLKLYLKNISRKITSFNLTLLILNIVSIIIFFIICLYFNPFKMDKLIEEKKYILIKCIEKFKNEKKAKEEEKSEALQLGVRVS